MKPTQEHLDKVNGRLAGHTMTAESMEVLPFLVFNTQQTDRYTYMSIEMMRKLEQDLNNGLTAFNKLHESHYALPVGGSISGRIIETADGSDLQAMMYAVTKRPDGTPFEEGKDLADRYATGAARACSAGVKVGFYKCNICGNDIRNWEKCDHIPGRSYTKDEQPITCVALMTGHDIVDGIAEDCGIYEVSAVTAGGVAAAGSLTEAFGAYQGGENPNEFKKETVNDKNLSLRLELSAIAIPSKGEENDMNKEQIQEMMNSHYAPLTEENLSLKSQVTEANEALTAKTEEFTAKTEELEAVKAKLATAEASEGFKAEYLLLVEGNAVKAGETEYSTEGKDLDTLKKENVTFLAKIATLPTGQQSADSDSTEYAVLDDAIFRV